MHPRVLLYPVTVSHLCNSICHNKTDEFILLLIYFRFKSAICLIHSFRYLCLFPQVMATSLSVKVSCVSFTNARLFVPLVTFQCSLRVNLTIRRDLALLDSVIWVEFDWLIAELHVSSLLGFFFLKNKMSSSPSSLVNIIHMGIK